MRKKICKKKIRGMASACWIAKARIHTHTHTHTHTHLYYLIVIGLSLRMRLEELASVLRHTYIPVLLGNLAWLQAEFFYCQWTFLILWISWIFSPVCAIVFSICYASQEKNYGVYSGQVLHNRSTFLTINTATVRIHKSTRNGNTLTEQACWVRCLYDTQQDNRLPKTFRSS